MRIILGLKTKVEAAGGGAFFCPACKNQSRYTRVRVARYFTFFFIPLFRTRTLGEYIQCGTCQKEFRSEVATLTRDQVEQATAPWKCPVCGNRNSPAEDACLSCEAPRKQGPPPLPGQSGLAPAALIMSPPPLAGLGPPKNKSVVGRIILIVFLLWITSLVGAAVLQVLFSKDRPEALVEKAGHEEGHEEFEKASKSIAAGSQGVAHGNTPEALELAAKLSESLGEVSKSIPTVSQPDSVDPAGGKFLVFCQLNEDSCAFLIHVPNLRHFDSDTQKSIAKMCYLDACVVLRDSGVTGVHRIAVAPRGALFYATALVGGYPPRQPASQEPLEELKSESWDVPDLYPFFTTEPAAQKPAPATPPATSPPSTLTTSAPSATSATSAPPTPATPAATPTPATPATPEPSAPPTPRRPAIEIKAPPSWVPVYPDLARPAHGMRREENGVMKGRATFETADPLDKVKEFYENRFKAYGFEITADKSTARLFENAEIAGRKAEGNLTLHIAIHQMKARTIVILTYEGADKTEATPEKPQ